jgi:Holliday junction resolvase RusA-like endonuclease
MDAAPLLRCVLPGKPQSAGSKTAFALRRKDKRGIWRVVLRRDKRGNESAAFSITDMNEKNLRPRAKEIAALMEDETRRQGYVRQDGDVGLAVEVTFFWPRPKNHYGTGRNERVLKASARPYKTTDPDTTKLWRALEDALTGILWEDDNQVVSQLIREEYCPAWENHRTELAVWRLPHDADKAVIVPEQASLVPDEGDEDETNPPGGSPTDGGAPPPDFPGLA